MVEPHSVREHYASLSGVYSKQSNRACNAFYSKTARQFLAGSRRVLEIGAGTSNALDCLDASAKIRCDISFHMLRHAEHSHCAVCADGLELPFAAGCFDALLCVNVVEHVRCVDALLAEMARILRKGGRALVVTPNGDRARLLHVLERLHLKLPEGPHRFVGFEELRQRAQIHFAILEHARVLAFPLGPEPWVRFVDRIAAGRFRCGLFQYIYLCKKDTGASTDTPERAAP